MRFSNLFFCVAKNLSPKFSPNISVPQNFPKFKNVPQFGEKKPQSGSSAGYPKPLTPNMMLFGEADKDTMAPGVFSEKDSCSKLYSRQSQHLMSQLIRRWYTEYLPDITRRLKWYKGTKQVEVDDVVVLIEPNEIRSLWQLGRITRVYPGPDGVVRIADVKLPNGSVKAKRSVGRLAVLDLKSSP